jgi:hypothetical protein
MAETIPGYPRHNPKERSLRAANADRDAICDILRRQHVAGRLDTDEFAERYGRSLQAKTYAELDELIADLPADAEPVSALGAPVGRSPGGIRTDNGNWRGGTRWAGWLLRLPLFIWLAVAVAIAVASGGRILWVAFPLLFFVRPLMWRSGWWGRSGRWGPWRC